MGDGNEAWRPGWNPSQSSSQLAELCLDSLATHTHPLLLSSGFGSPGPLLQLCLIPRHCRPSPNGGSCQESQKWHPKQPRNRMTTTQPHLPLPQFPWMEIMDYVAFSQGKD